MDALNASLAERDRLMLLKDMHCFRRILVCVNEPEQPDPALDHAIRLAKANQASLTLINVDDSAHIWHRDRIRAELRANRQNWLDQLSAKIAEQYPHVQAKVLDGRPALAISREVIAGGYDLVLKTSRADRLATQLFFGSTAIRLVRICPCPVWIVQPGHDRFQKILAAVDPFATSGDETNQNVTVVKLASSLAEADSCPFHVAGVIPDIKNSPLAPTSFQDEIRRYRTETARLAGENTRRLVKDSGIDVRRECLHCLSGHPGDALARFVTQENFDLIVLGTVARTGLAGMRIGNTTERVLHGVNSSVLAVKSAEFMLESSIREYGATAE